MTVESASDRASVLADFGQVVTFSPGDTFPNRNDSTSDITAIFDNGYFAVALGQTEADNKTPTLLARSADVADAAHKSMIEVGAAVYKVVGVEPDGTGLTVLNLEGPM